VNPARVLVFASAEDTVAQYKTAVLRTALVKSGSADDFALVTVRGRMKEEDKLSSHPRVFLAHPETESVHCVPLDNYYQHEGKPIFILDLTSRSMCVYLPLTSSVQELKDVITVHRGIPAEMIKSLMISLSTDDDKLTYKMLADDDRTLEKYGVAACAALTMVLNLRGN